MSPRFRIIHLVLLAFVFCKSNGQSACPENIGFENGSFLNWQCGAGLINAAGVTITPTAPISGRHTLLANSIVQNKDTYGKFPVNCPNGSGYSIKLGNSSTGAEADRVSYTFVVPAGQNEYSIIYNYAIVFQNPNHEEFEQPRFTSKVYDETEGEYLACGAFEFVASSGLPGFQLASPASQGVWYKPWSPVTVKLMNCAGKRITLEFTVNDCSRGGHFGYAYLDVNENCSSPITGNVYCNGAKSLTLTAPFGFQQYNWYTADFATLLGTTNTLHIATLPPVGTTYALEIIPFPGLGCQDTLYTKTTLSPETFTFNIIDTFIGCVGYPADITQAFVTQGSTPGLKYSYFTDSVGIEYLPTPKNVITEGTYYVKAFNNVGCTETKPIKVSLRDIHLAINAPKNICYPNTANITATTVTSGSDPGLTFTYWKDAAAASVPLTNPAAITETGTYFIKATNNQCDKISPIDIKIWDKESVVINSVSECIYADITKQEITAGSASIFTAFSQWMDSAATIPVLNPQRITLSGTYYIKASGPAGCAFVKPIQAAIKPAPSFTIIDPPSVLTPNTVNITNITTAAQNYVYSFWLDDKATKPLTNPSRIPRTGRYYIRALDAEGCTQVQPVNVTVIIPYHPIIKYPNAFSPNNDGVNDGFRIEVAGDVTYRTFKIFNRWGQVVFESKDPLEFWFGENKGKPLPVGTYYWIVDMINNNNQDFYRRTGSITLMR